jgi:hypothetical protein
MKDRLPLILSALALVVSLTAGGAYASGVIDGHVIADGSIAVSKLTPNAIRTLKGQRGPRGFRGQDGVEGIDGSPGQSGPQGAPGGFDPTKVQYVQGPTTTVVPGQTIAVVANCPAGTTGISGGYFSSILDVGGTVPGITGYGVVMQNNTTISVDAYAFAVCAAP